MTTAAVETRLPDRVPDVEALEELLSRPPAGLVEAMGRIAGDILVLGVAGKMGPTLARMAKRASEAGGAAGVERKVIGVSRFSNPAERDKLQAHGIETVKADLLDETALAALPDAPNVIYMAGMKFGSSGQEALTWAMNTHLPAAVCQRYRDSRIVAFSTGNVYGMVPLASGGSIETDTPQPDGEYATSCLGRERMFEYFSQSLGLPVSIVRLNYACELRYGILVDLAQKIAAGQTIDLTMGTFNIIWQGDANAASLLALEHCASPADVFNLAGPETLGVRRVCEQLAKLMDKPVTFTGEPAPQALLSNGQRGHRRYGYPTVGVDQLMQWVADWVGRGGETLGKPTKFEVRDGKF